MRLRGEEFALLRPKCRGRFFEKRRDASCRAKSLISLGEVPNRDVFSAGVTSRLRQQLATCTTRTELGFSR